MGDERQTMGGEWKASSNGFNAFEMICPAIADKGFTRGQFEFRDRPPQTIRDSPQKFRQYEVEKQSHENTHENHVKNGLRKRVFEDKPVNDKIYNCQADAVEKDFF